jgi:molecular chaperone GrpE (heat shock protein)
LYGKRESNERKYTDVSSHHLSLAIHDGFIPAEQFVSVQHKMDENKQICNKYKGSYTWLSGLVKCGKCGTGMVVAISKRNDNISKYFACRGRHLGICTAEKGQKGIHVEDVESEVRKQIFEVVEAKKDLTYKQLVKKNKETTTFETKIKELEAQISNLIVTMSKTSKITSNYINSEIERLDEQIKFYQEKLEKMKDTKSHETIKQFYDIIDMFDDLNLETKKEIVRKLIEKIHVTHEKIEIVWKYDFL